MGLNVLWCWDQFCGGDSGIFSECVFRAFSSVLANFYIVCMCWRRSQTSRVSTFNINDCRFVSCFVRRSDSEDWGCASRRVISLMEMFPTAKNHFCVRYSSLDLWPNVSFEELYLNFSCAVFCVAAIQRATWQVHLHRAVTRHAVLFTSLPPFFLCFPDLLFLKEHHSFSSSSCFLFFLITKINLWKRHN